MAPMKKHLSIIIATILLILVAAPALASDYIGNANSGKFHYADCRWAQKIAPYNIVYLNSRDEAISRGFIPCKVCRP